MQSIFDAASEGVASELGTELQARPNTFSPSSNYTSWLNVLENEYNPNDADLIITEINGQAIRVGDTINLFGGAVTLLWDQRLSFTADQEASVLPDLLRFNYTVSGGGEESTALVTLDFSTSSLPSNSQPQTTRDEVSVDFGGSVIIDALANDSDADGDALTITEIWYTPVAVGESVSVYGGIATLNADQTISFESDREDQGTVAFTSFDYAVSDGVSESRGYITITSEPNNYAPIAVFDTFDGTVGEPTTLDVLANDTDDEGDALSIIEINGQQIAVGETFDSGLGEITLNADQTLTFSSVQDDNGRDAYAYFNYTITDGLSVSIGYVNGTLASNNYEPNAYSDSATGAFGEMFTIDVLANDSDPEGDALAITEVNSQAIAVGETVTNTSAVVTLNADQTLTVVPLQEDQGERGYLYIYYDVSDGSNDDGSYIALTLEPENYAPVAGSDSIVIASGEPAILNVLADDTDAEGDPLTIASIDGVSIAVGETVSEDGLNITLNEDQTLSITGSNVTTGRTDYASFRYEVTDGLNSDDGYVSVRIEPANFAPETRSDTFEISIDAPFQANILTNDQDAEGSALAIVQLDGRIIAPGQPLALENGTATLNEDQTLTFVFAEAALGDLSLNYGVSDGEFITTDYIFIDVVSTDLVRGDFSTNTLLSINETITGRIDKTNDEDWYAVKLEAGQTYEISMGGNGSAVSLDSPYLNILNTNGETVASDYTLYSNEDASISLTPEDSGLFFVNAGGYFSSSIGDFALTITGPSPQPPTSTRFNIIEATETRDRLSGTAEADSFVFAEGSSTLGTIDTVIDWQPGDVIDLSAFGFAEGDIEARLISGGTVVKLIAGFGADDFQVRINLNGYTLEQLQEAIVFDALPAATPANQAPIANDDNVAGVTGAVSTFNVLDNDSDPDGDSISITSFTQAENGTVTAFSDDRFEYEPNDGFTGTDNFTYTIIDADGALSTATVNIEVAPILFLSGTNENDVLEGTSEIDFISGLEGNDTLRGLDNNDRLFGGEGDDTIEGGDGFDTLVGGDGDDYINGDAGNDTLDGGDGDDTLIGGNGWDILFGGAGNDTYHAGAGFDEIYLEGFSRTEERDTDSNTIIFTPISDIDVLWEVRLPDDSMTASFDLQRDVIDVTAFDITAAQALAYLYQDEIYDAVLDFGDFNQLFLDGIEASDLTAANFIGVTTPPPSEEFNIIEARNGRENIAGTDAVDAYTFAAGTSVNGAIDTVINWAPGDVIDLSELGLIAEDFEIRTVSGGTVMKLIEGFGAGEFHVRINLNGYSQEEVLASVIYDAAPPPPPVNTAPTANDDSAETEASSRQLIDVLANDTDPEDDLLSVDNFDQGANGTVMDLGNGVLEYTPNADFSGSDSFSYTISDEAGLESTATVTIDVTAPVQLNLITGTEDDEVIYGTDEGDEILGLGGGDHLHGLDGNDTIRGGDGRDSLYGGAGDDLLIGGGNSVEGFGDLFYLDAGNDTLIGSGAAGEYVNAGSLYDIIDTPIHIDLSQDLILKDGYGGTDSISNISGVSIHGSNADYVIGDDNSNDFSTHHGGADIFEGNGGDDRFRLEYAPASIDGGDGVDIVTFHVLITDLDLGRFVDRPGGVHVDLSVGQILDDGLGGQSQLIEIENVQGTPHSDRLIGDDGDNSFFAEGGDDFVDAKGGDDVIWVGSGNSTVFGGNGYDFIVSTQSDEGTVMFFGGEDADGFVLGSSNAIIGFSEGDGKDTIWGGFDVNLAVFDVTGLGISAETALGLAEQDGNDTLIDFGNGDSITISDLEASTLTEANFIGQEVEPPSDFNIATANIGTEVIAGTDGADAFTFAPGTSVNGAIDIILDWAPGDVIDLSQLSLTADDIEVRTISGGSTLKLIEGFGAGEFHVKINLNGNNQEDVLSSVIYEANESVSSVIASAFTSPAPEQASINDDMPLAPPSNGPVSGPPPTMIDTDQPEDLIGIDTPDWDFG